MSRITTFFMFRDQAEQAASFYTAIFKNSRILDISRYGEGAPVPAGTVMSVTFELDGARFFAANGGPSFSFSDGISLMVRCETQAEIDEYWKKLSDGGQPGPCGWLKDRYGVSWQIVPADLLDMLADEDPGRAGRVMAAMLSMGKLDLGALRKAYRKA